MSLLQRMTLLILWSGLISCGGAGGYSDGGIADESDISTVMAHGLADILSGIDDGITAGQGLSGVTSGTCSNLTYNGCTSTTRSKSANQCILSNRQSLTGSVQLQFSGPGNAQCSVQQASSQAQRLSNYSIFSEDFRTRREISTTSGQGVSVTRGSSSSPQAYQVALSGMQVQVTVDGALKHRLSISTTINASVSGEARAGRTLSGGNIQVLNSLTGVSCSLASHGLIWNSECKCPIAGSLTGSCTSTGSYELVYSSLCGSGVIVENGVGKSVRLTECEF